MSFLDFLHPVWKRDISNPNYSNNLNKAVLNAISTELNDAESAVIASKTDSFLDEALGYSLDLWGDWFGVYRDTLESDDSFRSRIKYAVLIKRGTIPALLEGLHRYFNDYTDNIRVYEPYTNIFYTNKSFLNGEDHMAGDIYNYAVIDVQFSRPFPPDIIKIINLFKPAGVKVLIHSIPYRYNPTAPISIMSSSTLVASRYYQAMIQKGMDDSLDGHLSLNSSNTPSSGGLFTTNISDLNGTDVLSGSYGIGSPSFNYACTSLAAITITNSNTIADLSSQGTPVNNDFYALTGTNSSSEALVTIPQSDTPQDIGLYAFLDLKTYLQTYFPLYMENQFPSGDISHSDLVNIVQNYSKLFLYFRVLMSTSVPYSIKGYNYNTSSWDILLSGSINLTQAKKEIILDEIDSFINDNGILGICISVPQLSSKDYSLALSFLDWSFNKYLGKGDPMLMNTLALM